MATTEGIVLQSLVSSISVVLYPDQQYVSRATENKVRHSTLSGVDVYYAYNPNNDGATASQGVGEYKDIQYNIGFTPFSDAMIVNEWWLNQDVLIISEFGINDAIDVGSLHLINQTQPFNQASQPYWDLWQGRIVLTTDVEHMGY